MHNKSHAIDFVLKFLNSASYGFFSSVTLEIKRCWLTYLCEIAYKRASQSSSLLAELEDRLGLIKQADQRLRENH